MIDPRYYGLIELILVGGIALGIGFWQLRSVDRELKRGKDADDEPKS
jgi:hypothetical protein